ncbi:MAG: hypothetical protein AAGE84_00905 [Cyanobacteria bacterium P01_G01_bin.39]
MSLEIKNLSYLEVVSEDHKVKGGFFGRNGGNSRNEAGSEAFATALGRNTKSFTSVNADAIEGFGSSSRAEAFAGAY